MKTLRPFAVVAAFVVACSLTSTAHAQSLELESDWFYTDAPGWGFDQGYNFGGFRNGDTFIFWSDYYLVDNWVLDSTLYVSFDNGAVVDYDSSGEVDNRNDEDSVMLSAGVTLPPNATGRIWVEFTIDFADGTSLADFRYVDIE